MRVSFHDRIVMSAWLKGERAILFRAAAQRHANAFWGWLALAGLVWYFTSWAWALIPFALAILTAAQSISATVVASKLEKLEESPSFNKTA